MAIFSRILLITFLLGISVLPTTAQDFNNPNAWAVKLSEYRMHLLTKNSESVKDLERLLDKWDGVDISKEDKLWFARDIMIESLVYLSSYKNFKRKQKKFEWEAADWQLTEEDYNTIIENAKLLAMIQGGYLKSKYPYVINPETEFFKECNWYDIKDGETIGEVGAGLGQFSLMLHRNFPNNRIFINELNKNYISYLENVLLTDTESFNRSKISLTNGLTTKTNFYRDSLDKIIIRNSFHHFEYKNTMLNSVYWTLKKDGELLINEEVLERDSDSNICSHAMYGEEIVGIAKYNVFDLVEAVNLNQSLLMRFQKNEVIPRLLDIESRHLNKKLIFGIDYEILPVQDEDNVTINEMRFYHLSSALDCSKMMFEHFEEWSYDLPSSNQDNISQLVWDEAYLFRNSKSKSENTYKVCTDGSENGELYFSSIRVFDQDGNDCLDRNYKDRDKIISFIAIKMELLNKVSQFNKAYERKTKKSRKR